MMMAVIVGLQVVEEVRPDRMLLLTLKQSSLWQDLLFEIFQCVFRIQRLGTCRILLGTSTCGIRITSMQTARMKDHLIMDISFGKGGGEAIEYKTQC